MEICIKKSFLNLGGKCLFFLERDSFFYNVKKFLNHIVFLIENFYKDVVNLRNML